MKLTLMPGDVSATPQKHYPYTFGPPGDYIVHPAQTWDDCVQPAAAMSSTGAFRPPNWALFRTGAGSDGVMLPQFARSTSVPFPGQTKDLGLSFQLPHRYDRGQNMYLHLHWSPGPSGAVAGVVAWKVEWTFANIGAAYPVTQIANLSYTIPGGGVANYASLITSDVLISGAGIEESSVFIGRLYRDAAAGGDTWASDDAFLLSIDLHVPIIKPGTKYRSPPWDTP